MTCTDLVIGFGIGFAGSLGVLCGVVVFLLIAAKITGRPLFTANFNAPWKQREGGPPEL